MVSELAKILAMGDPEAAAAANSSEAISPVLAGALSEVNRGIGNASSGWLDMYNRALSPAMLNEPLGAWRRLAALGASVPIGATADSLAIGGPALARAAVGTDVLRGSDALANLLSNTLGPNQADRMTHDPFTGAFTDANGRQWY